MRVLTERHARLFVLGLILGLPLIVFFTRWLDQRGVIEVHAAMPENGGWSLDGLTVEAGQTLRLRLVSDDVLHGFAIGQDDRYNIELKPGQPVETALVFERPGKYVYYCTRWCGLNHWRMRGTIDVTGQTEEVLSDPPFYVTLNLDIDAEHHAIATPSNKPSAKRGQALNVDIPVSYLTPDYHYTHSPSDAWQALRVESGLANLDDGEIWDIVAYIWHSQSTLEGLAEGERLYAANCAACHGESGAGDGVMASSLNQPEQPDQNGHTQDSENHGVDGHDAVQPTDFTDAEHLLGASPAILHGKIVRGGMGTGMPYWGPIFTDEQIWNTVAYLWTFQFEH